MGEKQWTRLLTIPGYLVQGIGDNGMVETYDEQGELIESDDLRISIKLSAGYKILLDGNQRIILQDNGNVIVEAYVKVGE